jgi:hypothetical protein
VNTSLYARRRLLPPTVLARRSPYLLGVSLKGKGKRCKARRRDVALDNFLILAFPWRLA